MNILSLFDGISCFQVAAQRAGLAHGTYYAAELDKHAIQMTQDKHPETVQMGDVTKWREWNIDWASIGFVSAGFPCQSWSLAGKQLGDKDERGMLFWVTLDIIANVLKHNPSAKFVMENVKMKKEFEQYITMHTENALGEVHKTLINSALVSAQNRSRYYWTNFAVSQPNDKDVKWGDVRENGVEWSPMYYSDAAMEWIGNHGTRKGKRLKIHNQDEKMQMVEASHFKKYSAQRFFGVIDQPANIVGRRLSANGKRSDYDKSIKTVQCLEVRGGDKIGTITTVQKDNALSVLPIGRYPDVFNQLEHGKHYRYVTPLECERLQTLPDNYTLVQDDNGKQLVSNTQRYKAIGNGMTADVMAHIIKESLK